MPTLTQPPSLGDVLKYELNPNLSRETVTLATGTAYPAGAVLGQVTATGLYALSPDVGADGSEVANAVLLFAVDATDADAPGLILARGPAIVAKAALGFDASIDDAAKRATKHAQLAALGIVPRDSA